MKVLINDGNRHMQASGYGALSRAILLALKRHSDLEVVVEARKASSWNNDLADRDELMEIPEMADSKGVDAVLRIGSPGGKNRFGVPTLVYTQNALGDLPPKWVETLSDADAIIVPGNFDALVFRHYFSRVFTCTQFVDPRAFKPVPRYRQEGPDCFSFIFVGSYSFRKGVDLLFPAFSEAFSDGLAIHLQLHCFSGLEKEHLNHLLQQVRNLPNNVNVSVFNGTVGPSWMRRFYNRHDAVLSFSRGEGWAMPLHEGLMCGMPVIAPDSTAMGEFLPVEGVRRIAVKERLISNIDDPFGTSMRNQYGHSGNICWEVDKQDAARALREVVDHHEDYKVGAITGRQEILDLFTLKRIAQEISTAIKEVVQSRGGTPALTSKHRDPVLAT